jgi:hypothetical protein
MAAALYSTKVGDTFYAECTFEGSDGAPVILDDAQISVASSLLSPDESRRIDLAVEPLDQAQYPGRYNLRIETADFDPGYWTWDIRYRDANGDFTSATGTVRVLFTAPVTL